MRRSTFCVFALVGGAISTTTLAAAYCPCYTKSSSHNDHNCGVEAVQGTNPTPAEWQSMFDLAAKGPSAWGDKGPSLGDIGQGCGKPEAFHKVAAKFPCELLKAIAMHESGWRQFCVPDRPSDQAHPPSRTIISFDCGYGVGQVTSGMHTGETPDFDRQRVASDPMYNLATGTKILAGKWSYTNCVGDNQPSIIEDWYTATWAYNGLAYSNNPNNPNLDANRGVYDPKVGGSYTYQERIFGRMEHPPSAEYWTSVGLAYPNRKDCGTGGKPPDLPEPNCASPTDCTNHRSVHVSSCLGGSGTGGAAGAGGSAGTGGVGGAGGIGGSGGIHVGGAGGSSSGGTAGVGGGAAGSSMGGWSGNPSGPGGSAGQATGGKPFAPSYETEPADGCACRIGGVGTKSNEGGWLLWALGLAVFGWRRAREKQEPSRS